MGYYTNYKLKIHEIPENLNIDAQLKLQEEIDKYIENHDDMSYAVVRADGYWNGDECKWYDHLKDMKEMSLKFKDVVFELEGQGEENEDMWKAYYKNGKEQYCEVVLTFEDYDESKLK